MILKVGDRYVNVQNVFEFREITDGNGDGIAIIYDSTGSGDGTRNASNIYGDDAKNLRRWLDKHCVDVAPKA